MNTVQPIRDERAIEGMKNYFLCRNMRDYLLFCKGIYSGLRISDLRLLKVADVRGSHVGMVESKNKHAKRFIIHPSIRVDLDNYIADMDDSDYLFPSRQIQTVSRLPSQPIHRTTAYRLINDAAQHFKLKNIGVHSLRKTWGYRLYKQDPNNLALLMEMFGHKNPAVTLRYIGYTQDMMDRAISALS